MKEITKDILKLAKSLLAESTGLNGMNNREAKKFLNYLLEKHTKGYFNDESWAPVHKTFKELDKHSISYDIQSSKYRKENGIPVAKRWMFTVNFINDRGRPAKLNGTIVASGAGSVDDPLDRYDVVAYIG